MTASPRALLRAIARWPTESQLQARRNALVASTATAIAILAALAAPATRVGRRRSDRSRRRAL